MSSEARPGATEDVDIVVVGVGHAGCEAAAAAARLGQRVVAFTFHRDHVGRLSCNPAVGGQAKGHLVRELDALGGLMARVTDASTVQFRRLNTRKGLAVQASRAQVDIAAYPARMAEQLAAIDGLEVRAAEVVGLVLDGPRVAGVTLADGSVVGARAVILTTGTFLRGKLHQGEEQVAGGRVGDGAAVRLADQLADLGLRLQRLKTGTVPRLDGRSIAWDTLPAQPDLPHGRFSYAEPAARRLPPLTCHLTYTSDTVHQLLRDNLERSAMFSGAIDGTGPRYCPSIEDKVVRFPDRDRHLLFLEPEGHHTHRVYVNGLSTSMPVDVQERMVRAIDGLHDAVILQPGYAVEYDAIDPTVLGPDLQHEEVAGLYFAGQVNGTSGYEEAAVQGFVAGVSAATGQPLRLARDEAYIGVLVDDLTTRGVGGEPYRMFTSRAEHRLLLREDNADRRLMERGRQLGLIDDLTWAAFEARQEAFATAHAAVQALKLTPAAATQARLAELGTTELRRPIGGLELLRRPEVSYPAMAEVFDLPRLPAALAEQLNSEVQYAGYLRRAERRAARLRRMSSVALPEGLDFTELTMLSIEVRQRLTARRPATLGEAGRVPGVTAAALDALAGWVARNRSRPRGQAAR